MSVTTDMQNLIPKTQEVGRVRHIQERQAEVDQRQAGTKLAQEAAQRTRQVPTSPQTHGAKIERDKRDGGGHQQREQNAAGRDDNGDGELEDRDPERGNVVDVRV